MNDFSRLIEHAFPLKQTSLESVHEKNVRHGHISTLHIWPARRPLAACRAALIATLLPDPGDPDKRRELCEKIAGTVVKKIEKKKMPNGQTVERIKEQTEGGILHWGRETENADTLQWFRQEIRKAYGGRAPKILDPFAGGGAIPLEAMRLGCEATAVDINPVAWFILKCTLDYPQKLAGQKCPLPVFILEDDTFMDAFYKAHPSAIGKGKATKKQKDTLFVDHKVTHAPEADLSWHVRAWGQWVLDRARRDLTQYYPTYADFEPITKDHIAYEHQPMRLMSLGEHGTPDVHALNAEFTKEYLGDKRNPRWIVKPTVAYLWARTVKCKNCRAELPLLKTLWLCRKDRRRILLTMTPKADETGVIFGIKDNVPLQGGNAAQKREHDKRLAFGTMSRAGAKCPCCPTIMTMEDIRVEGKAGRLGSTMTAVVVDGPDGKAYRLPTPHELSVATVDETHIAEAFRDVPFGVPDEPTPKGGGSGAARAFSVQGYGLMFWRDLFTSRQLTALGTFVRATRTCHKAMIASGYQSDWADAIAAFLTTNLSKTVHLACTLCTWHQGNQQIRQVFSRYALPVTWDFAESLPSGTSCGSYASMLDSTACAIPTVLNATEHSPAPSVLESSAIAFHGKGEFDAILTDPPYYDAIPYSDAMDFFYIWIRRVLHGTSAQYTHAFADPLAPKWNKEANDGELIDDDTRHDGNAATSKASYEDGMARVFQNCHRLLTAEGRAFVVFANKNPDAWETLASAMIRAGFVVEGSWPIETESASRTRALASAALASSIWLVCKKRSVTAKVGWDTGVLEEMRSSISLKLQAYWDAGIRGPDFVWAATGPALEAYSKHPAVRKANEPNAIMSVGEFLNHVRRIVVDYVVGQVLTGEKGSDLAVADRLDEVTAYYLLHRHDFGMGDAPIGACILYATACGLSDTALEKTWDILSGGGRNDLESEDDETEGSEEGQGDEVADDSGGSSKAKLKVWSQRMNKSMGHEAPEGKAVPLIDRIHRVMHLWKEGYVQKVDEFLDQHALRRNELFKRVVQSLIELSSNSERSLLESISNHIGAKGAVKEQGPMLPGIPEAGEA